MYVKIILISISKEELKELVHEAVAQAINAKKEKELLSFKETCDFFSISAFCLNHWKTAACLCAQIYLLDKTFIHFSTI